MDGPVTSDTVTSDTVASDIIGTKEPNAGMRVFALTIAYDGTRYAGWQNQLNAISIQQRLEEAVEKGLGIRTSVVGSGRTDSGVHAIGQVARLATNVWKHPPEKLIPALNRRLPRDIVVRQVREAPHDFDPIRNAIAKRYRYTIRIARCDCPMRNRFHWYYPRPIDDSPMQEAAEYLLGCHDFAAFQSLGSPRKTTVRTIREIRIQRIPNDDGYDLVIDIEADGFLYNMVRNIVGALVEVGTDRFSMRWIEDMLQSRNRRMAGITAPPHGLCLMHVTYRNDLWPTESPTN